MNQIISIIIAKLIDMNIIVRHSPNFDVRQHRGIIVLFGSRQWTNPVCPDQDLVPRVHSDRYFKNMLFFYVIFLAVTRVRGSLLAEKQL